MRDALDALDVPAVINGAGSVFGTRPARDWLRLLEAIERPASPHVPGSLECDAPGSQAGDTLGSEPFVSQVRQLPSGATEYTSWFTPAGKLRVLANAIRAPSGDQAGRPSETFVRVSRVSPEPSAAIT